MTRTANLWIRPFLVLSVALVLGCQSSTKERLLPPVDNPVFWTVNSVGADKPTVDRVQRALQLCQRGLGTYFPSAPKKLTIFVYATRPHFVQGLQEKFGYPPKYANYFATSSAPRPKEGTMLVPPDQTSENICHEVVHHYMESFVAREHLLSEKWFDEGVATLLSAKIMAPDRIKASLGWLFLTTGGEMLPLQAIRSERSWGVRHSSPRSRQVSYLQAMSMAQAFFTYCGKQGFLKIIKNSAASSIELSLQNACGFSVQEFYEKWSQPQQQKPTRLLEKETGESEPGKQAPTSPQAVNLSPISLQYLIKQSRHSLTDSLVIYKDNRLVVERYLLYNRQPLPTMSVTKSIVGLAIGMLLGEGKIESLDQPLWHWIPAWKETSKAAITLRHILTHTSGLKHAPADGDLHRAQDAAAYALAQPLDSKPGSVFSYNNEAVQLLSLVVQRAAKQPVDSYLQQKLFQPLAITKWSWQRDPSGNPYTYTGLTLSAQDLAKIGRLLLNDGLWQEQQIVPAQWLKQMTKTHPMHPSMGLLWWVTGSSRDKADHCYFADGWLGQYLVVCPQRQLVAVRQHQAVDYNEQENRRCGHADFIDHLLAATRTHQESKN